MAKPRAKQPMKAAGTKKPAQAKPEKVAARAKGAGAGGKPRAAAARKQSKTAKQEKSEAKAAIEEPVPTAPAAKQVEEEDSEDAEEEQQPKMPAKGSKKSKAHRLEQDEGDDDDGPAEPKAVVYLGGIPNGFEESQIRKFLGQFGDISRMRLARSAKTARPKGYAFIEFKEASVAKIVADTMDKYLLFGKQMKCHVLDDEKRHPRMFRGAFRRWEDRRPARLKKFRTQYNDKPTVDVEGEELPQATMSQVLKHNKKRKSLQDKLTKYGIEYALEEVLGEIVSGKERGALSSLAKEATKTAGAEVSQPDAAATLPEKKLLGADGAATQGPAKKRKQRA